MANSRRDEFQQRSWQYPRAADNDRQRGHEYLPGGGGGNHMTNSPEHDGPDERYGQEGRSSGSGYVGNEGFGRDSRHDQGYGSSEHTHYGARGHGDTYFGHPRSPGDEGRDQWRHQGYDQDFGRHGGYDRPQYQHGGSPEGHWSESGTRQGQRHHDPDYDQWRNEQISNLDRDYHEYRQERYKKFSSDFDAWRSNRPSREQDQSSGSSGSSIESGNKSKTQQSGSSTASSTKQ
ncbi:MAG: hypothetical protein JO002_12995 [Burkholderiaceae bacterium]|nr:hypothetical protein [Burkholderiaceae bacterium]